MNIFANRNFLGIAQLHAAGRMFQSLHWSGNVATLVKQ
jgi:hypothetical protein